MTQKCEERPTWHPDAPQNLSNGQGNPACGCPRQADLWLCHARPDLERTPDGRECELGALLEATDDDYWPGAPVGAR